MFPFKAKVVVERVVDRVVVFVFVGLTWVVVEVVVFVMIFVDVSFGSWVTKVVSFVADEVDSINVVVKDDDVTVTGTIAVEVETCKVVVGVTTVAVEVV